MLSPTGGMMVPQKKKITTYGRTFRKRDAHDAEAGGVSLERDVRNEPSVVPRPVMEVSRPGSVATEASRPTPEKNLKQYSRTAAPRPQPTSGDIFDVPASPPRSLSATTEVRRTKPVKKVAKQYGGKEVQRAPQESAGICDAPSAQERSRTTATGAGRGKIEKVTKQYGPKEATRSQQASVDVFDVPASPKRSLEISQSGEGKVATKRRKVSPPGTATSSKSRDAMRSPMSSPPMSSPSSAISRAKSPAKSSLLNTRTTLPTRDVVMKDMEVEKVEVKTSSRPVQPVKTLKQALLERRTEKVVRQQIPPSRPHQVQADSAPIPSTQAPVVSRRQTPSKAPVRGRRLIDTLAAQADDSSEDEGPPQERKTPELDDSQRLDFSSPGGSQSEQSRIRTFVRQESAKKTGPKFTYSQQRTMRMATSSTGSGGGTGIAEYLLNEPLFPTTTSNIASLSAPDEEEEPHSTGAVNSIHELRQAGANNRFADDLDDLLERIGSPTAKTSSSRRNALLELAQKVQDKAFRRQFRDHGGDTGLVKDIGKETDVIAAYALVAIFVTLLSTATSVHLTKLLRGQGFANTLSRLLSIPTDITLLAKERKSNLSRYGQQSIASLKSDLLKLPVWEPFTLQNLSPRSLALKALDAIFQQQGESLIEEELFSAEVTRHLFSILSGATDQKLWDWPPEPASYDLYIAMSLLETRSVSAMQRDDGAEWTTKYLPIVADVLGTALEHQSGSLNELEILALKLTLNTANNNPEAPQVFLKKGLLWGVAEAVCGTFETVMKSITDDSFLSVALESLVLMLGVMINFSEHDPSAGQALGEGNGSGQPPLDNLIRLFLNHYAATAEADSVEKSQLNVAFGYLSLLLGYLSLHGPVRDRFSSMHKGGNLDPLLNSIREFIAYHKVADDAMAEASQDTSRPFSSFTEKLMGLVNQLESGR